MRTRFAASRRAAVSGLLALAIVAGNASPLWAHQWLWTTIGSTGTVEAYSDYQYQGPWLHMRATYIAATLLARYNVPVPPTSPNVPVRLKVTYANHYAGRVVVRLKSLDGSTGTIQTVLTLDSNSLPLGFRMQETACVLTCFDVSRFAYFVEAWLTKPQTPHRYSSFWPYQSLDPDHRDEGPRLAMIHVEECES